MTKYLYSLLTLMFFCGSLYVITMHSQQKANPYARESFIEQEPPESVDSLLDQREQELNDYELELARLKQAKKDTNGEITDYQQESEDALGQNDQTTVAALQSKINDAQGALKQINKDISATNDQINTVNNTIEQLTTLNAAINEEFQPASEPGDNGEQPGKKPEDGPLEQFIDCVKESIVDAFQKTLDAAARPKLKKLAGQYARALKNLRLYERAYYPTTESLSPEAWKKIETKVMNNAPGYSNPEYKQLITTLNAITKELQTLTDEKFKSDSESSTCENSLLSGLQSWFNKLTTSASGEDGSSGDFGDI